MFALAPYLIGNGYSQLGSPPKKEEDCTKGPREPYQVYRETERPPRSSTPDSLILQPLNPTPQPNRSNERELPLELVKAKTDDTRTLHSGIPTNHNSFLYNVHDAQCTPLLKVTVSLPKRQLKTNVLRTPSPARAPHHAQIYEQVQSSRRLDIHKPEVMRRWSVKWMIFEDKAVVARPLPVLPGGKRADTGAQENRFEGLMGHIISVQKEAVWADGMWLKDEGRVEEYSDSTGTKKSTPTDARSRYSLARPPAARLNGALPLRPTGHEHQIRRHKLQDRPLPPLPIAGLHRKGPCQPPWISLDQLSVQKRERSDVRRRDGDGGRDQREGEWMQIGCEHEVGWREKREIKSEVQGYREAILQVYPDMAFDGRAGKGGRRNCGWCCGVM